MSIPTILDRFPTPPCAKLLGLDILEAERDGGRVKIAFTAKPEFRNAAGNVQGGFLSAMLDDCMGPAVLIATDARIYPSTIDLNVQYLAPAKPGRLIGKARVVQLGKTIGFVEAELADADGKTLARATASLRLSAIQKAVA
ncbi:PaaI family thioesterase [Qipengyuania qiaonensis]|uniref:PaaI family thioesterase n=1 Tax=Qipengyuania qiaonensis TaxID=2867240 RepID=A0ABS7J824_9SPHN|nr:PaaI family thioesterase [Qipengyuania qiaonensis]MBX7482039.1 PaaI family thioesterase [Qipengyuania qiaonensis]